MKDAFVIIGTAVTFAVALTAIFFSAALSSVFGALAGWLAAIWFPATAIKITAATGLLWYQLGAILGFVGSFFRPVVTQTK